MKRFEGLRIVLADVKGRSLTQEAALRLVNVETGERREVRCATPVVIEGLSGRAQSLFRISVRVRNYRTVQRFVPVTAGETVTITLPLRPDLVKEVRFPAYRAITPAARNLFRRSRHVEGLEGAHGRLLYGGLDNERRAGLLNIFAKCDRTRFADGRSVLHFLSRKPSELVRVRRDRLFARVPRSLFEVTARATADRRFVNVNGALHREPGYERVASFKTPDAFGNLQLTFFRQGDTWLADIDIDDASGLEHVFQVVRNALRGKPTHPYDIHQILLQYQELDPGYELVA